MSDHQFGNLQGSLKLRQGKSILVIILETLEGPAFLHWIMDYGQAV